MTPLAVVGRLTFPSGAYEKWLALPLDADAFSDWPDAAPLFRGESAGEHATVKDVLAAAAALDGAPSFIEVDGDIAGFLLPEHTTRLHQDLATALRLAAELGATGAVSFVAIAEKVALHVAIGAAANADEEEEEEEEEAEEEEEEEEEDEEGEASASSPQW